MKTLKENYQTSLRIEVNPEQNLKWYPDSITKYILQDLWTNLTDEDLVVEDEDEIRVEINHGKIIVTIESDFDLDEDEIRHTVEDSVLTTMEVNIRSEYYDEITEDYDYHVINVPVSSTKNFNEDIEQEIAESVISAIEAAYDTKCKVKISIDKEDSIEIIIYGLPDSKYFEEDLHELVELQVQATLKEKDIVESLHKAKLKKGFRKRLTEAPARFSLNGYEDGSQGTPKLRNIAGKADKERKEKETKEKLANMGKELYDKSMAAIKGKVNSEAIDEMFEILVPASGKADTVAGEIIRAVSRIGYRYNNDGDIFSCGYGLETVAPSLAYLCNTVKSISELYQDCKGWSFYNEDSLYERKFLEPLYSNVVEELTAKPELFGMHNEEDSRNTDASWIVENQETEELEIELWCPNLATVYNHERSQWGGVLSEIEFNVEGSMRGNLDYRVDINSSDDVLITVYDVPMEDYETLEQDLTRMVEDMELEYEDQANEYNDSDEDNE